MFVEIRFPTNVEVEGMNGKRFKQLCRTQSRSDVHTYEAVVQGCAGKAMDPRTAAAIITKSPALKTLELACDAPVRCVCAECMWLCSVACVGKYDTGSVIVCGAIRLCF